MIGVDLGHEERDVLGHAVIARVAEDGVPGLGERLLDRPGDGGVERREDDIAFEPGLGRLDRQAGRGGRQRDVEPPRHGFRVRLPGAALGRGERHEIEPGMAGEQLHEALSHGAGRAEHAGLEPRAHRSASSRAVAAVVFASRYFTMTGV